MPVLFSEYKTLYKDCVSSAIVICVLIVRGYTEWLAKP